MNASHVKEMEQLPVLNKELGYPAANKLYAAAQRAGIRVTIKQVQEFVSKQNVRQVFHKLPPVMAKSSPAILTTLGLPTS